MMQSFDNKVAVITGGASGIGFATAAALGRAGAKLVLADIELQTLEAAAQTLKAQGFDVEIRQTDVADRDAVFGLADFAGMRTAKLTSS